MIVSSADVCAPKAVRDDCVSVQGVWTPMLELSGEESFDILWRFRLCCVVILLLMLDCGDVGVNDEEGGT